MFEHSDKKREPAMTMALQPTNRLETPTSAGYRAGMNTSCIIGRKLGILYEIPSDMPSEVDELLRALDRRLTLSGRGC